MDSLEWHGRQVAWETYGAGPPLVFCHGTPWSSVLWRPYADALSKDFTVYLWDMPGFGQSSKVPGHAVDLGVQGELFAYLLNEWGLRSPHVVAHDYGGAVSLRAHLLHQADLASLFLADVVVLRPWGSPFFRLVKENTDVFTHLPPAIHQGMLRSYISGASHAGLTEPTMQALLEPWLSEEGQPAFYHQIAQADEEFTAELEPLLSKISAPVKIVWGKQDTWLDVSTGDRLAAAIPESTATVIDGAGHLIQYDAPVALASELRSWLSPQLGTGTDN